MINKAYALIPPQLFSGYIANHTKCSRNNVEANRRLKPSQNQLCSVKCNLATILVDNLHRGRCIHRKLGRRQWSVRTTDQFNSKSVDAYVSTQDVPCISCAIMAIFQFLAHAMLTRWFFHALGQRYTRSSYN